MHENVHCEHVQCVPGKLIALFTCLSRIPLAHFVYKGCVYLQGLQHLLCLLLGCLQAHHALMIVTAVPHHLPSLFQDGFVLARFTPNRALSLAFSVLSGFASTSRGWSSPYPPSALSSASFAPLASMLLSPLPPSDSEAVDELSASCLRNSSRYSFCCKMQRVVLDESPAEQSGAMPPICCRQAFEARAQQ